MKLYFKRAEMEEYFPELFFASGAEQHVNHRDCPAGEDTKRRLYVKSTPDAHLFYCHHCQMRGYYRKSERLHRVGEMIEDEKERVEEMSMTSKQLLQDLCNGNGEGDINKWPTAVKLWWLSYELDQEVADTHHVQWLGKRLWFSAQGACWQGRGFINDWIGTNPARYYKYITLRMNEKIMPEWNCGNYKTVVVVEDIVSAYKVRAAGYNAIAALGCKIKSEYLPLIAAYSDVVVWFDEDAAGMAGSLQAVRQLSPLSRVRRVEYKQPKETSFRMIKEIVNA